MYSTNQCKTVSMTLNIHLFIEYTKYNPVNVLIISYCILEETFFGTLLAFQFLYMLDLFSHPKQSRIYPCITKSRLFHNLNISWNF